MNITLEMMDEMRERTGCTYDEARNLLEKNNGNLLEAICEFERMKTEKPVREKGKFMSKIKDLFQKGMDTKLIAEDDEKVLLTVPILLAIIVTIIFPWLTVIGLGMLIILGFRLSIKRADGIEWSVYFGKNKNK